MSIVTQQQFLSHGKTPRFQNVINPPYPVQFLNDDGTLIDFTVCNPATDFSIVLQNVTVDSDGNQDTNFGDLVLGTGDWEAVDASKGKFKYWFGLDDLATIGDYFVWITALVPGESAPRAFDNNKLTILSWNGESVMSTHVIIDSAVLPPNAAQESNGNLALIATKATGILAALLGIVAVNDTAAGTTDIAPANGAPTQTNANNNTVYALASQANHWAVQNNSPNAIYVQLGNGNAATLGSMAIAANGGVWREDAPATIFNIYSTATTSINGNTANGIVIWGRS